VAAKHLLDMWDLDPQDVRHLISKARELKSLFKSGVREPLLARRILGLLFEKPSLRTRVSFESAMAHLGGTTIYLGQDVGWKGREPVADFANVLGRYVDAIVFRGSSQESIEELARFANRPVINGLTKDAHPCQALGDLLTIEERFGSLKGKKLAYIGDGNNVASSLAIAAALMDVSFVMASPKDYGFDSSLLKKLEARFPRADIQTVRSAEAAARGAHVIYTDVWVSMGDEAEREQRLAAFQDFQVNNKLMSLADPTSIFLHCLPAHRGEEVTEDVIDSPRSAVYDQAENRLHIQKAVLTWLIPATGAN
jgi:ornithine carbamoyltransferase